MDLGCRKFGAEILDDESFATASFAGSLELAIRGREVWLFVV